MLAQPFPGEGSLSSCVFCQKVRGLGAYGPCRGAGLHGSPAIPTRGPGEDLEREGTLQRGLLERVRLTGAIQEGVAAADVAQGKER